MASKDIHTYCPMCIAQCGVVATVEDGRFTKIKPDSDHPNGGICIKGYAAPQMVYAPDRLMRPMKRTRPKGDPDPGWVEISWDDALDTVATRLLSVRAKYGAEAVVFTRSTPAGSASSDYEAWCSRLANVFGSPNLLTTTHICTWNMLYGSKHTFGMPMPPPDYENTRCILLWGANPRATFATSMKRIMEACNRGARLIVIDPRGHRLAQEADCWLRVRPGSDGALALAMTHVLLEEQLYDREFVRDWTNAPLLVRDDSGQLLAARDLWPTEAADAFVVWDSDGPVAYRPGLGYARAGIRPALDGSFACRLGDGRSMQCRPVFALLAERAKEHAPELSEKVTWVPAADVRRAARLFAGERPSCLFSWAGLEMHTNAMQTNRAVSCFYALTGQYDARGSNLLKAMSPSRPPAAPHLLPKEKAAQRLGLAEHPLGPPADPGIITAGLFYDAVLTEKPYSVKALVAFGGDALLAHGDGARGQQALEALDFYVHMDMFVNPTASFADILLPAATPWESEALKTSFGGKGGTEQAARWAQLRKALVPPAGEARSDLRVIFDLAQRMGLGAHFFDGDIEAGWRDQLEPSGLTLDALRASPVGLAAKIETHPKKYAGLDPASRHPRGFPTPTRRIRALFRPLRRRRLRPLAAP